MGQKCHFLFVNPTCLIWKVEFGEWQKSKCMSKIRILVQFRLKKAYFAKNINKKLFAITYVTHCMFNICCWEIRQ